MQSAAEETKAERKPYTRPQIIHELELETRAGTPTGPIPDPLGGLLKK